MEQIKRIYQQLKRMNKEYVDNKTITSNITKKQRKRPTINDNIMKEQPIKIRVFDKHKIIKHNHQYQPQTNNTIQDLKFITGMEYEQQQFK